MSWLVTIRAYTDSENRKAQIHAQISEALSSIGVHATNITLEDEEHPQTAPCPGGVDRHIPTPDEPTPDGQPRTPAPEVES